MGARDATVARELEAFLAARDDAERDVAPSMRSIAHLRADAERSYLLLHGLTASPPAWSAILERLASETRANVIVLRLPLHGHTDRMSEALRGLSHRLLVSDLSAVTGAVAALGVPITVAGHSLGGTLALQAATDPRIERVVAIAPFVGVAFLPLAVHDLAMDAVRRLPNVFLWWNPLLRERQEPQHGYPRYPWHALAEGVDIAKALPGRSPRARSITFVLNGNESSVNNRAAERLARHWTAAGAGVEVRVLRDLPISHDIIDPSLPVSDHVRDELLAILASTAAA
ncbi:MAG: alpha/beta fold hydrolase [Candidatus Velthaea sp.]|jgi:carboxylesterase